MRVAVGIILVLAISGCTIGNRELTTTTYLNPQFTSAMLESEGLVLLPLVAGDGVEGFRRPIADAICTYFEECTGKDTIIDWRESMTLIQTAGLARDYRDMIQTYRETGILDSQTLMAIREATDKRFFMYVQVSSSRTDAGNRVPNRVTAWSQVWDSDLTDVVWEGFTSAEMDAALINLGYIPFSDVGNLVAHSIVREFFPLADHDYKIDSEKSNRFNRH